MNGYGMVPVQNYLGSEDIVSWMCDWLNAFKNVLRVVCVLGYKWTCVTPIGLRPTGSEPRHKICQLSCRKPT